MKYNEDFRKFGILVLGTGVGLFLFGVMNSDVEILKGVGVLVGAIGISCFVAEYLFPSKESK